MDLKTLHEKLMVTGEKERLKEQLRLKLVECGWTKHVTKKLNDLIQEQGLDQVTAESLAKDVLPEALVKVPKHIRQDFYQRIQSFLDQDGVTASTQD
ncbi:Transcription and mRNA export factor eny2 [Coelomomyces lativittatus]|nr:Transcription and mRNA export factor eny2 [Coelomomyces lativittatus]KAJ1513442.1 Transcription and mRNA export factor eny2 [Coelomomyces lativittatus]